MIASPILSIKARLKYPGENPRRGGIFVLIKHRRNRRVTALTVLCSLILLCVLPTAFHAAQSDDDATPEIACGRTLVTDDFSDPTSGWLERSNESVELGYTDEESYRMSTTVASNVIWSWAPVNAGQLPEGFCLSVRAQELNEGDEDDGKALALGLMFAGRPNAPSFHTFGIAPASGVYRVRDRDFEDGISVNVVDWTQTEAFADSPWQELELRVDGRRAQVYLNGERLHEAELDARGSIGVFLESFDDADVTGLFDDFTIRALAE